MVTARFITASSPTTLYRIWESLPLWTWRQGDKLSERANPCDQKHKRSHAAIHICLELHQITAFSPWKRRPEQCETLVKYEWDIWCFSEPIKKTEGEYLNPEQNKKTISFEGKLRSSIWTLPEIHLGLLSKTHITESIKKIVILVTNTSHTEKFTINLKSQL